MNIKNKKTNIFSFNKISSKKGIAMLFAIMLSTIFLTIALGVLSISVNELNFSTSGKDTDNAFFAADSGVECALYNDKSGVDSFSVNTDNNPTSISCFGGTPQDVASSSNPLFLNFSFIVTGLGSNGDSCAKVTILKTLTTSDSQTPTVLSTKIVSKGYNVGDETCGSDATNRVERQLEVNY